MGDAAAPGPAAGQPPPPEFKVVSETVLHQRYLTLYNRVVQYPSSTSAAAASGAATEPTPGRVYEFDVIGHPQANNHFSVTFPYHPLPNDPYRDGRPGGEVTLLREYCQGVNGLLYCLPTGGFDPRKHASYAECAAAELSEEAHLTGGTWVPLVEPGHPGVPEVKWCANRFHSFLCIDPQPDGAPGPQDGEEFIEVLRVTVPELRRLMRSGDMLLPAVATCYWALEELNLIHQLQQGGGLGDSRGRA